MCRERSEGLGFRLTYLLRGCRCPIQEDQRIQHKERQRKGRQHTLAMPAMTTRATGIVVPPCPRTRAWVALWEHLGGRLHSAHAGRSWRLRCGRRVSERLAVEGALCTSTTTTCITTTTSTCQATGVVLATFPQSQSERSSSCGRRKMSNALAVGRRLRTAPAAPATLAARSHAGASAALPTESAVTTVALAGGLAPVKERLGRVQEVTCSTL